MVAKRCFQLTGHIICLSEIRPAEVTMNWTSHGEKRQRGRSKKTWRATVKEDLGRGRTNWYQAPKMAEDRLKWNQIVAPCYTAAGRDKVAR